MTRDEDLEEVQREIVEAWWTRLSEDEKQQLIDRHFAAAIQQDKPATAGVAWRELDEKQRQQVLYDLWFATRPAEGNQGS